MKLAFQMRRAIVIGDAQSRFNGEFSAPTQQCALWSRLSICRAKSGNTKLIRVMYRIYAPSKISPLQAAKTMPDIRAASREHKHTPSRSEGHNQAKAKNHRTKRQKLNLPLLEGRRNQLNWFFTCSALDLVHVSRIGARIGRSVGRMRVVGRMLTRNHLDLTNLRAYRLAPVEREICSP